MIISELFRSFIASILEELLVSYIYLLKSRHWKSSQMMIFWYLLQWHCWYLLHAISFYYSPNNLRISHFIYFYLDEMKLSFEIVGINQIWPCVGSGNNWNQYIINWSKNYIHIFRKPYLNHFMMICAIRIHDFQRFQLKCILIVPNKSLCYRQNDVFLFCWFNNF